MRYSGLSVVAMVVLLSPAMARAEGGANQTAMNQAAVAFVKSIFANWSKPNAIALPYMDHAYAKNVNFYGGMMTHAAVMKNEQNFADRWQIRDYTVKTISNATCHVETSSCTITGIVHWNAEAPGPKLHSQGDANFSYTVLLGTDHPLIEAESGSVLKRKLGPLAETPSKEPTPVPEVPKVAATNNPITRSPAANPRWYQLDNYGDCVPAQPRNPAALVNYDRMNGLSDDVNVFETIGGEPVGVKIGEPQGNDIESVYTFFRTASLCREYEAARRGALNDLK